MRGGDAAGGVVVGTSGPEVGVGVGVGLGCGGGGVLDVAVEDTAQEGNGDAGDGVVELARGSGGDRG